VQRIEAAVGELASGVESLLARAQTALALAMKSASSALAGAGLGLDATGCVAVPVVSVLALLFELPQPEIASTSSATTRALAAVPRYRTDAPACDP
jgi:hypothetical protein